MHPLCEIPLCNTCKSCRDIKCKEGPSCTKEPESIVGGALIHLISSKLCSACRRLDLACRRLDLFKCNGCGKMMERQQTNKESRKKVVKCLDCLHPPCSVSSCTTCKSCRDPACKSSDCTEMPTSLHLQKLRVFASKSYFI